MTTLILGQSSSSSIYQLTVDSNDHPPRLVFDVDTELRLAPRRLVQLFVIKSRCSSLMSRLQQS